ncbi:MAG TPA: ribosome biogenesis GTPase YlqF [Candidatus Enterosoma merdigallinarum]|nr:ribosome biogenesis GTPase YlqF [Candidatus Enterosoma merdigallinarum]
MHELREINWFPGHMKKAINKIREKLDLCDGVIEIGDARAPFSSFPSYLDKLTENKAKVFILSKADLADPMVLKEQMAAFRERGVEPFSFDIRDKKNAKILLSHLAKVRTKQDKKYARLGFPAPSKRFMVLGIPNVGKSTLINMLSGKKKAPVENKPGKTRDEPLLQVSDKIYIHDTPGILEPNYENKEEIARLAILGSVRMDILPLIALTDYMLEILLEHYKSNLEEKYKIVAKGNDDEIFQSIARSRNLLLQKGQPDSERARKLVLTDLRSGALGRISLDR